MSSFVLFPLSLLFPVYPFPLLPHLLRQVESASLLLIRPKKLSSLPPRSEKEGLRYGWSLAKKGGKQPRRSVLAVAERTPCWGRENLRPQTGHAGTVVKRH